MALPVIQRYLLVANGTITSVAANGTGSASASSAIIPLSGQWTINLLWIAGAFFSQDNSGELNIQSLSLQWLLLGQANQILFTINANNNIVAPVVSLPKLTGEKFQKVKRTDLVMSSLDQTGGVISGVQAFTSSVFLNVDAANPHSVQGQINAIVEFVNPGTIN